MQPHISVGTELLRFLRSLLLGLPCGLLLELFRTLRALLPHHPLAVFLEDAVFSFAFCFFLQCYAWSFCAGALRWQYAFGAVLGLAVWLCTAGALWTRMLLRIKRCCCTIRQKIKRIFVGNTENSRAEEIFKQNP